MSFWKYYFLSTLQGAVKENEEDDWEDDEDTREPKDEEVV